MPLYGSGELAGAMAAIPVTFGSGRQGRIPVMAIVDATGVATASLPQGMNRSGTIVAGGVAQQLAPANANRRKLEGQNLSAGDLWVNDLGVDAGPSSSSTRVQPGGSFEVGFANAVSIWGATTGQAFTAGEG